MSDIFLAVQGCDDTTYVKVSEEEAAALQFIIDRVNAAASYGCKPGMEVVRPGDKYYEYTKESWEYQEED